MRRYEDCLMDMLKGETPKAKYETFVRIIIKGCEMCEELTAQEGLLPDCEGFECDNNTARQKLQPPEEGGRP